MLTTIYYSLTTNLTGKPGNRVTKLTGKLILIGQLVNR